MSGVPPDVRIGPAVLYRLCTVSESEEQSPSHEVPEHSVQAVEDTVVNEIIARQARGEFPEVLPSETPTLGDITASVDDVWHGERRLSMSRSRVTWTSATANTAEQAMFSRTLTL